MAEAFSSATFAFLKRLLDSAGPAGFEAGAARVWREEVQGFADRVDVDVVGNSVASVNPDGTPRVLFTGHIDEIGLMITHVDDEGFLYFRAIGAWDPQVVVGQRVEILTEQGPVVGLVGKRAVHLIKKEDRDKASTLEDLWLDIGAKSKEDAAARVSIGDPAVLDADVKEFPNRLIASRSVDNRIGSLVAAEALRLVAEKRPTDVGVFAIATVQEEISYEGGGARPAVTAVDPQVAVVVDVTHATDHPNANKKEQGDIKLGGGPVLCRGSVINPVVFELLKQTAVEEKIPYQVEAAPHYTGTDADAIHNAWRGIPTGLVSIPNRYMHSPNELVALEDLANAAKLLAAFARRINKDCDWTPR